MTQGPHPSLGNDEICSLFRDLSFPLGVGRSVFRLRRALSPVWNSPQYVQDVLGEDLRGECFLFFPTDRDPWRLEETEDRSFALAMDEWGESEPYPIYPTPG